MEEREKEPNLFFWFLGLQQGVPVCNGFPRVRQHLIPMVSAEAFGSAPDAVHANDLVMTHPGKGRKR